MYCVCFHILLGYANHWSDAPFSPISIRRYPGSWNVLAKACTKSGSGPHSARDLRPGRWMNSVKERYVGKSEAMLVEAFLHMAYKGARIKKLPDTLLAALSVEQYNNVPPVQITEGEERHQKSEEASKGKKRKQNAAIDENVAPRIPRIATGPKNEKMRKIKNELNKCHIGIFLEESKVLKKQMYIRERESDRKIQIGNRIGRSTRIY